MNGKNKFNIVFILSIIIFTSISSTPAYAAEIKVWHKGNAYSNFLAEGPGGTEAINGWSTVVISTSSLMDSDKRTGRTTIQAWARFDTIKAMFKNIYPIQGVEAIETKFKTTTASSSNAFDIFLTNPGTKTSSHTLKPYIFDILDYKVPGVGLIGTLAENYSNAITTSGTVADISNTKNGTITFKRPADASLSNNISWKNANQVIGSYKKSGVTAEFNFRILNGVQINVAPQARVQYGFHTYSTITPIKIWSNYAYVNHTLN